LYPAPDAERAVPRVVSAPLSLGEAALRPWLLGQRLPLSVDFGADMAWSKRAASLHHVEVHLLLFVTKPFLSLVEPVRRAAAGFERGKLILFYWLVTDDSLGSPMFSRYGVTSMLDCPKLLMLDQRLAVDNRQRPFRAEITEENVAAFLRDNRLAEAGSVGEAQKDEL